MSTVDVFSRIGICQLTTVGDEENETTHGFYVVKIFTINLEYKYAKSILEYV